MKRGALSIKIQLFFCPHFHRWYHICKTFCTLLLLSWFYQLDRDSLCQWVTQLGKLYAVSLLVELDESFRYNLTPKIIQSWKTPMTYQISYFTETYGTITFSFVLLYLCYTFLQQLIKRRSLSQQHGCKPPKATHPSGFLGLGFLSQIGKQIAEGQRLDSLKTLYDKHGTTYLTHVLGRTTVNTIAPENLRMIYAINFDDYGAEAARLPPSAPTVGELYYSPFPLFINVLSWITLKAY